MDLCEIVHFDRFCAFRTYMLSLDKTRGKDSVKNNYMAKNSTSLIIKVYKNKCVMGAF